MQSSYDVAVIGGAIAGASTAYLLKRKTPSLRILIIEKTEAFDRKVGESTSEVGACFLMRVLNLAGHLGHQQITKSGLRMWFYWDSEECFTRCGEVGPKHQTRLPAFQLDRSTLMKRFCRKRSARDVNSGARRRCRPSKAIRPEAEEARENFWLDACY
jgi:2-polyprenyl-6-methoxyphenol hydroxylase-like FAD-dependent oxidoreductase